MDAWEHFADGFPFLLAPLAQVKGASLPVMSLPLPPSDPQQQQHQALIPSPPRRMQQQQQHPPRDEWLLGSSDRPRGMSGPTGGHDPHPNNVYRGEAVGGGGGGGGGYSDFNLAPTFSYESSAHNYPPPPLPRRTSPPDHTREDVRYYDPRHNHHNNSTSPDQFAGGEATAAAAYSYSTTTTHNMAQQHTDYPEVNQTKGTMFVTELSELMELDSGDHARLANILDDRWTGHGGSSSGNPNPTTSRGTTPTGTAGRPTSNDYAPPIPNGSYPRRTPTFSSQPPPPQSHVQHSPPHHHQSEQQSQPRNQQYNPYNRNY
jgi:hypothetical protein